MDTRPYQMLVTGNRSRPSLLLACSAATADRRRAALAQLAFDGVAALAAFRQATESDIGTLQDHTEVNVLSLRPIAQDKDSRAYRSRPAPLATLRHASGTRMVDPVGVGKESRGTRKREVVLVDGCRRAPRHRPRPDGLSDPKPAMQIGIRAFLNDHRGARRRFAARRDRTSRG